jgi:iron complex transport system substrate-binding protein
MLFEIGAGNDVVAVSSFDRYPPEVAALPRVGALIDPDVERILALRPTLVVIYASQDDLRRQLQRAGIARFEYRHGSLADVVTTLREVGARVGRAAAADQRARQIEQHLASIHARVAPRKKPTVLLVFGREPNALRNIYASGGYGFLHDMLVAAGGENVFADVNRESVQATSELILARAPEVIIELRATGLSTSPDAAPDPAWNALAAVPAVRDGRITVLEGDQHVVPGPYVAATVERLAQVLHP